MQKCLKMHIFPFLIEETILELIKKLMEDSLIAWNEK